jgi:hypothetical protein
MTNYLTAAETAKHLRQALRSAFPGMKFSVRTQTYAGGVSIDVTWTDGPFTKDVEAVTRHYTGASFDGMTDTKHHHSTLLAATGELPEEVHFGADFIFTHRQLSTVLVARLTSLAETVLGRTVDFGAWYDDVVTEDRVFDSITGYGLITALSESAHYASRP